MQVIIVTPGFAADVNDSTCIPYLQDHVLALSEMIGTENIRIIALHYPFTGRSYEWNGIQVFPLNGRNRKWPMKFFFLRKAIRFLTRHIQGNDCIVHAYWLTDASYIAIKAASKKNALAVATAMGQDVLPANRYIRMLPLARLPVIVFNEKMQKSLQSLFPQVQTTIIPLSVQVPPYEQMVRDIDLLFAGSFTEGKQPGLFVSVILKIKEIFLEIRCVMIGDGPLSEEVLAQITKEHLDNTIYCTGRIERNTLMQYMYRSKILLHTSVYEGSATVIEEAVSCGMHVCCFDVGRNEHPNIHVCRNAEEMVTKTKALLQDNLDHRPAPSISMKKTIAMHMSLYHQLLASQHTFD